jgi:hypothetical protein
MSDQPITPEFKDLLRHTFGIKKGTPMKPAPLPIHSETPRPKGVAIGVAAQAQRIYNPNLPPTPPKVPPKSIAEQGSAPAMDMTQPWAGPKEG